MNRTKVSVVKCDSYDEKAVYEAVKKSLSDIGFDFNKIKDRNILIKPNALSQQPPEKAITTHPSIVDAVIKIIKPYTKNITIGESSGFYKEGGTKRSLKVAGIEDVAKKNNVELISFDIAGPEIVKDKDAVLLKKIQIAKPVLEADFVVSLSKLKTHMLTKYTGAVKNLFGTIPGGIKQSYHLIGHNEERMCQLLLDIYQNIKPGLNIIDGILGLEGEGPGSAGIPRKANTIIASENAIAADIVGQRTMGYNPKKIYTTKHAIKRGLFPSYDAVEVIGKIKVVNFKKPAQVISKAPKFMGDFVYRAARRKPHLIKDKCKKCGICATVCPAKCITLNQYPHFNHLKCFSCYCCHENCPYKAIELKGSTVFEFLRKIKNMFFSS